MFPKVGAELGWAVFEYTVLAELGAALSMLIIIIAAMTDVKLFIRDCRFICSNLSF